MLKPQQLDLLRKSNKTLAILGFFRSEDEQIRYVFKNSGGKDGKISIVDLFAKLKPELCSCSDSILEIGAKQFNKYSLYTPLKALELLENRKIKQIHSQPVLFDSPLLDGTIYSGEEAKAIQEQGKKVVKQLVENLDTVAYFSHSNFSKCLVKIAKHYLFEEANRNLEHKIADDAQWYKTINSDNSFCSRMVQYITAHEQDESEIETAFRKYLKTLITTGEKRIYTDEQIDKLTEALIRCKRVMLDGTEDDLTWKKIALSNQFTWLKDYASDPHYGLSHPQIGRKVGDKHFLAYYNSFMEASDKIHRIVRTQAIHSSVFCWLAGKYKKWDSQERVAAGREMYRIGVQGQGEKRIRSENTEARLRNLELIKQAKVEVNLANQIDGDENYQLFAEKAEDNIFDALLPDRAVTRKALRSRAKILFKKLNQISGGKAGQLLRENYEFNQLFVKYYRCILNTELDENIEPEEQIEKFAERLHKEAAKDQEIPRFNAKFGNFDIREFIDIIIDEARKQLGNAKEKKLTPEELKNHIKSQVKEAFISEYAQKSKNRFAEEYFKNQDQIKREEQMAEDLYDLRSIQEVSAKELTAGAPVYVMTDFSMPDFRDIDADIKKIRKQNTQKEAHIAAQTSLTLSVTAPKPITLQEIPAGQEFDVTNGANQKIGTCTVQEDNIMLSVAEIELAEEFTSDSAAINVDGKTLKIQELDIPEVTDFPKQDEIQRTNSIAQTAENHYEQLSKSMNKILEKYRDEDYFEPDFNRAFRSLLLCEYIQAAPQGATQLGREDLSNILGLMVDITEHLGEVDNNKILDGVLSEEPETLRFLQKINLSKYYPAEKPEDISLILQYHYELCNKLYEVKNYLEELAEIKNFFEIMQGTDLEIVFLNTTIDEYGTNISDLDEFSFHADSPSVVYLTSQANATGVSIEESLVKTADTLAKLINTNSDADKLQIPIFISSQELSTKQVALPLICPNSKLDLHKFAFTTGETSNKDKFNITVNWQQQQNYYLLLGASIMLPESSTAMGSISKFKPLLTSEIKKLYDVSIKKNQTIVELLRQMWLSPQCKLLDSLIFTKWLNLILLAKPQLMEEQRQQDEGESIKEYFGLKLDQKLWNPKNKELAELCQTSFSTIKQLANIPVKVEMNNQFSSPTALGGGTCSMTVTYGTSLEREPKYIFELPWKDLLAEKLI
jgi:hypothetical protein